MTFAPYPLPEHPVLPHGHISFGSEFLGAAIVLEKKQRGEPLDQKDNQSVEKAIVILDTLVTQLRDTSEPGEHFGILMGVCDLIEKVDRFLLERRDNRTEHVRRSFLRRWPREINTLRDEVVSWLETTRDILSSCHEGSPPEANYEAAQAFLLCWSSQVRRTQWATPYGLAA